ncbi:MAG: hypothetical protein JXR64_00625 [Spirochaetales bacterium]|nr:hypothetical protein [Spirochaetales bacterium]
MPDKKIIILSILIVVLFFLLFPLKFSSNLSFRAKKAIKLTGNLKNISNDKIPFIYKNKAGFFSIEMDEAWVMKINDGVVLLNNGFINYSRSSGQLDFINFNGELEYSIINNGYPFSIEDRLFIISRDRKSLSEYVNGDQIWTRTFNYIITDIDANKQSVILGFMNGYFEVLTRSGDSFYVYEPGGSRLSIIYGCNISDDGKYLAIISGLSPQRFSLYELKNYEYKPVFAMNLEKEFRKTVKMKIPSDNKIVLIEGDEGFYVVDFDSKSSKFIKSDYKLINARYMKGHDVYMVHTGAVNFNNVRILARDFKTLLSKDFFGDDVQVSTGDDSVFIVIDDSALRLDLTE